MSNFPVGWLIRSRFPPFNNQQVDYSIPLPNWAPLFFLKDETKTEATGFQRWQSSLVMVIPLAPPCIDYINLYQFIYMIMIIILMVLCRSYYSWIILYIYNQQFIVTEVHHILECVQASSGTDIIFSTVWTSTMSETADHGAAELRLFGARTAARQADRIATQKWYLVDGSKKSGLWWYMGTDIWV